MKKQLEHFIHLNLKNPKLEEIDEIEMAKWGVQGMTKEQSDEHGFFNTVRRRKKEEEE